MSDLETFRRETRAWLEANCPPEMRRPMTSENDTYWGGRNAKFSSEPQRVWFERMRDKGWTVPDWPKEYGGGGLDRAEHKVLREEMSAIGARVAAVEFRHLDARAGAAEIRQRGAEEGTSAENRRRPDPLVPGLFRAERRIGPRLAADPRRERRRRLRHHRPEDLDVLRQLRRLDLLPGAHRSRGEEARRHQLHPVRHGLEGRVDQADPADLGLFAVLRNLLRQCPRAEIACGRHRQPRLGCREISAAARARDDLGHGRARRRPAARPGRRRFRRQPTTQGRLDDAMLRSQIVDLRDRRGGAVRPRPNARSIWRRPGSRIRRFPRR